MEAVGELRAANSTTILQGTGITLNRRVADVDSAHADDENRRNPDDDDDEVRKDRAAQTRRRPRSRGTLQRTRTLVGSVRLRSS